MTQMQDEKIHATVQLSKCSQAVGAREVLAALRQSVMDEGLQNVVVDITGCMGLCGLEPIVIIKRKGKRPVTYCRVTPEMARVILVEYVHRGNIIKPLTLDAIYGEGMVL